MQPEIIISKGYTLEVHHVQTADGYILSLHRIPSKKKPVLLMHGIFASDFVFSAGPTNSSLGIIQSFCIFFKRAFTPSE